MLFSVSFLINYIHHITLNIIPTMHTHAGIPGTYFDSGLRLSALQKLIGGVIGGAGAIIAALISITGTILKMKGILCCKGGN